MKAKATKMEGTNREYDTIQEREVIGMKKNEAYHHVGGRGKEHLTGEGTVGADAEYEEIHSTLGSISTGTCN